MVEFVLLALFFYIVGQAIYVYNSDAQVRAKCKDKSRWGKIVFLLAKLWHQHKNRYTESDLEDIIEDVKQDGEQFIKEIKKEGTQIVQEVKQESVKVVDKAKQIAKEAQEDIHVKKSATTQTKTSKKSTPKTAKKPSPKATK